MIRRALFSKMILIAFFAGLLLFQGCVANDAAQINPQTFAQEKDFDGAVEYYTRAIEDSPNDLDLKLKLKAAKQKASMAHMRKGEELISKKYFREAIEELQISIAFYSSNHRAIELVDEVKKMKESFYYTQKGNQQVKTGSFDNAKRSFQRAIELDPGNEQANLALAKFKRRPENLSEYRLDLKTDALLSLKFKQTPVTNVFEILSKLEGINFIFDKDVKETKVTLFTTDVTFDRFLDVLLKTNSLQAKMINQKTLLIYPDTPAKAKEYDELYVKTFYLSYLKSKDAVAILTKILKSKNIIANEKLNAITIRGQKESVEMAARLIEANDRTPSEVVLNVEIMEVKKSNEQELGLSISDTITFGVSEESDGITVDSPSGFAAMASFNDISKITSKELYMSLPTATLKLLKKDGDTRILAKPQLRVSSSEKASILIGEKVPLRSNRVTQTDGSTTYDYIYQDVGVKLTVEPVINMYEQITLKMYIEISALGSNVGTVTDPQYSITTRTTETVLTINDGDSVIIGGLISDEERETITKIPFLGDIPRIGRLFSSVASDIEKTDVLMSITPFVIRNQDIPDSNISEFWSGNENEVALEEPVEQTIERATNLKEVPDEDFILVVGDKAFLPSDTYFSVQVYSSQEQADADARSEELEGLGYQTWVRPAQIKNKGTYFRVFVGQYPSYQTAETARAEMLTQKSFPKDIHVVDRTYVYGQ
jgi:general secretion pathway protein D